ncbi:MAG: phosphodiesterase [Chloroflexaceae bacterium]|nr:phosphodiesterase [Chloroflexaceae bacterium]
MTPTPQLLVIGLDCAEPSLVFERWRDDLPNLRRLMQQGAYGRLQSCIPAITVPAWSCLLSGRDPGELGIYGFRNRADRSYAEMRIADSQAVRFPRLWELLGQAGWRVAVLSVPGTSPPPAVHGSLISCFLTPSLQVSYTHPPELAQTITEWLPEPYLIDVPNFRSEDKQRILADIYTICDQRFALAQRLLADEQPDLLLMVEMGVDRIHHAFWRHMDPQHPRFVPDSPFAQVIHDYYCHVDAQIGRLLAACAEETVVLVVSDHGARALMGGFCLNQWLIDEGYLVLHEQPAGPQPLDWRQVNWSQTRAWGAGGYYGRIFLNVQGRESEGAIAPATYEHERQTLATRLEALSGPDGQPMGNRAFVPKTIYQRVRGIAPDLIVYFGDLAWRSVGTIGVEQHYTLENDTGPDDANHAQDGLFIWVDPQHPGQGQQVVGASMYDIVPTLLKRWQLAAPAGLRGRVLDALYQTDG